MTSETLADLLFIPQDSSGSTLQPLLSLLCTQFSLIACFIFACELLDCPSFLMNIELFRIILSIIKYMYIVGGVFTFFWYLFDVFVCDPYYRNRTDETQPSVPSSQPQKTDERQSPVSFSDSQQTDERQSPVPFSDSQQTAERQSPVLSSDSEQTDEIQSPDPSSDSQQTVEIQSPVPSSDSQETDDTLSPDPSSQPQQTADEEESSSEYDEPDLPELEPGHPLTVELKNLRELALATSYRKRRKSSGGRKRMSLKEYDEQL